MEVQKAPVSRGKGSCPVGHRRTSEKEPLAVTSIPRACLENPSSPSEGPQGAALQRSEYHAAPSLTLRELCSLGRGKRPTPDVSFLSRVSGPARVTIWHTGHPRGESLERWGRTLDHISPLGAPASLGPGEGGGGARLRPDEAPSCLRQGLLSVTLLPGVSDRTPWKQRIPVGYPLSRHCSPLRLQPWWPGPWGTGASARPDPASPAPPSRPGLARIHS